MSIPLRSYSSYREGKRAPSLSGITRTFFAQTLSGSLHRVCGKARSVFGGNRYEQSALPLQLHFQWSRSNGNGAFFPTNLERHPRLDAGLTANVFRNHQSSGMINGGFHGAKYTIANTVRQVKPRESLRAALSPSTRAQDKLHRRFKPFQLRNSFTASLGAPIICLPPPQPIERRPMALHARRRLPRARRFLLRIRRAWA